eukprot:6997332-Alexandrium_andersonii.AAC.1
MHAIQNRFTRSSMEPRRPRNGLKTGPCNSRGVRPALLCAQIPNLPTNTDLEGVRGRKCAN